jgi:DnaJ-class molecular chaperone
MSNRIPFCLILFSLISFINTETDYYKLLGVSRDASVKEIKKAFRTLSLKYHPDRNPGDKEAHDLYIKINRAHEVLTDKEKREIYDIYGEEGLNKEFNIQQRGKERGPNAKIDLFVDLKDLYNGITRTIEFEKNVMCTHCHGTGGKLGKTKQCPVCKGRGVMMRTINMGMMSMQMQQPCDKCNGKGIIFSEVCPHCHGSKLVREKKKIDIIIEKGMENNQNIVFRGEAEPLPDRLPGDLIMTIKQKNDPFFKERRGNDLYCEMKLNLKEALFGYNKKIKHMDGREFYIESNKITQPNEERIVSGEGMPVHKFPSQKGDLHINFKVVLPKTLNKEEKKLISEIFSE